METITWADFERIELRVGTIVEVDEFPEAKKPAWKLTVDFGPLGTRRSSAQITTLYRRDELVGRQVLAVVNFPPKRIGPFESVLRRGSPARTAPSCWRAGRPVPTGAAGLWVEGPGHRHLRRGRTSTRPASLPRPPATPIPSPCDPLT
jgi:tRNA-binding protein